MVQLEALRAMYNLCRISRTRQEAAAVAGMIPRLTALAVPPPPSSAQGSALPPSLPHVTGLGLSLLALRISKSNSTSVSSASLHHAGCNGESELVDLAGAFEVF